ncbi:MAG: enoyl-CoA hydratase-related protein [Kofleriaceae bacterium]
MSDDDVLVARDAAGVVRVTLNRPDARNALSRAVNQRLRELAVQLDADPAVRAVVITGAGEQAFCAGADLKERRGVTAADTGPYVDAIAGAIDAVAALRVPTIAAMNGSAFGGGLELALACDFRVMVTDSEVGLTEVRLGIMPGAGGTQRLPRLVGEAHAKELILLGRRISARRAYEIGLATAVVAPTALAAAVDDLLRDLLGCAPLSVRQAKTAIERGLDGSLADGLRLERTCYDVTLFSADRDEGLAAFAERRAPRFAGR